VKTTPKPTLSAAAVAAAASRLNLELEAARNDLRTAAAACAFALAAGDPAQAPLDAVHRAQCRLVELELVGNALDELAVRVEDDDKAAELEGRIDSLDAEIVGARTAYEAAKREPVPESFDGAGLHARAGHTARIQGLRSGWERRIAERDRLQNELANLQHKRADATPGAERPAA
jgi:hypothetical protein